MREVGLRGVRPVRARVRLVRTEAITPVAAAALGLSFAASALHGAQVTDLWTGGSGTWLDPANWSNGVPNNAADTYLVVIDSNPAINSSVTAGGSPTIDGLTLDSGDTLALPDGISLRFTSAAALNNNGSISLGSTTHLTNLHFADDLSLSGTGTINLSGSVLNRIYSDANGRLTIAAGLTLSGSGQLGVGTTALTNAGTILANSSGGMVIQPSTGGFVNTGLLQASNGATLTLDGSGYTNTGGTIAAQDGSVVQLSNSPTITGGTLATFGTGVIRGPAANLSGVTIAGNYTLDNLARTTLFGDLTNNGQVSVNSTGGLTDLVIAADLTLGGSGTVRLSANANNRIYATNNHHLTIGPDQTIRGSGQIGTLQSPLALTNNGHVIADGAPGLALFGTITNNGAIQVADGSQLNLSNATLNGGNLTATGTGTIHQVAGTSTLAGASISGPLLVDSGTLVANNVTQMGDLTVADGGRVEIDGTSSLTGTLFLNGATVPTSLTVSGTLGGAGTIQLSNSSDNSVSGALTIPAARTLRGAGQINSSALTNAGLIDANQSTPLSINNSTVVNTGTLQASGGGHLWLQGNFTNTGGTIQALDASEVRLQQSIIHGGTLLSSGSGFIHGAAASIVTLDNVTLAGNYLLDSGSTTMIQTGLTNNGTIHLNAAGVSATALLTSGDLVIGGSGSIQLSDNINNRIAPQNSSHLTLNQNVSGSGRIGPGLITNNATIDSNGTQGLTLLGGSAFTNAGTLQASNGGNLILAGGAFTNTATGVIQALGGSEIQLANPTVINSTITGTVRVLAFGNLRNSIINGAVILNDRSTLNFTSNPHPLTSTLSSLTLGAGAVVNLGNDNLRINYGTGASPNDQIRAALVSGYNHGNWHGLGINSSAATTGLTLGYADSADGGIAGVAADANAVLVNFTRVGDLNLDGKVDVADLLRLAQNYGASGANWDQGDVNYDGSVGFPDLLALAQNYGTSLPPTAPTAILAPVPEPSLVVTAGVVLAGMASRRRRADTPALRAD